MQFEPATFAEYDEPVPPGGANPPSPYDQIDADYAAARDLCANGGENGANLDAEQVSDLTGFFEDDHVDANPEAHVGQTEDVGLAQGQPTHLSSAS